MNYFSTSGVNNISSQYKVQKGRLNIAMNHKLIRHAESSSGLMIRKLIQVKYNDNGYSQGA